MEVTKKKQYADVPYFERINDSTRGKIHNNIKKKMEPNSIPSVHIDILLQALMHMNNTKKSSSSTEKHSQNSFWAINGKLRDEGWTLKNIISVAYFLCCHFFSYIYLGLWGFFHVFVYLWVHYTVKMHTENFTRGGEGGVDIYFLYFVLIFPTNIHPFVYYYLEHSAAVWVFLSRTFPSYR